MKLSTISEVATYLSENRTSIIKHIDNLVFMSHTMYKNKRHTNLKDAMVIFKETLEATLNTATAYDAVESYVRCEGKVERGFFLTESNKRIVGLA